MSDTLDVAAVENAVAGFKDPETGRDVKKTNQVRDIAVDGNSVTCTLGVTSHCWPIKDDAKDALEQRLKAKLPQMESLTINVEEHHRRPPQLGEIGLTAKTVIAVGSGKGGVGKSTVAASLACGLMKAGCKVGLMDADVYGPSIPHLLNVTGRPEVVELGDDVRKMKPVLASNGMPVMSVGFFVDPEQSVIWRGPMLHQTVTQFLRDCHWGDLDYLIVDMPPGTGDVALSLSQLLPVTGAVVVCTPQEVALLDAVKAIDMFKKVKIPVMGMVENMSGFVCPDNGKKYDIFGSGGAREKAHDMNVPFLGEVPILMAIRENGDAGQTVANFDDPQVSQYYDKIVYKLVKGLSDKAASAPATVSLPVL